ncbi:TorD/DmsD family molecular chaperone [Halodesulfurarchaeum sp.]|uniref:TorD/DmsD family molecular chaperone n=1 Tax=Halodesulfurarchaeum sp. TaxID=1980530 RepID=UPI001BBD55E0|nr:molecular chaperone TorD family protein [Halodesulfurarchaeum sp.]
MADATPNDGKRLDEPAAWSQLQVILSNCLKHPDDSLRKAIVDGALESDLEEAMGAVGVEAPSSPPAIHDRDLTEDYEALFGAFQRPFAPPAASPYKEWYDDSRSGLMDGPPASRMENRYEALEITVPEAYPADHVALQLEYASLLTEAGEYDELAAFVETELDWIDAFAEMVSEAVADAPFYRFCVDLLVAVVSELRMQLGVSDPTSDQITAMLDRVEPNVTE